MHLLLICSVLATAVALSFAKFPVNDNEPRKSRAWSGRRDDENGRLPRTLNPLHYNVEVFPYFYFAQPPFSFSGKVSIWFEVDTATDVITINNNALTVDGISIRLSVAADSPGNPPQPVITDWVHDQEIQFLHFNLADNLVVGERYVLSMAFTGTISTPARGSALYWDSYVDENGDTVYLVGTQLEAIAAREMFPCFDEPDMKATFNTTVVYKDGLKAFANTPVANVQDRGNGFLANTYDITPKMSTYLVCIVIGDYVDIFSGNTNGYDVTIWTRPQLRSQMAFAANLAVKSQAWLEDMTGHRYPIAKMDHVSMPNKAGAMENWGLITYGEGYLAINPETSPAASKILVGSVVSHELAHQWYGNLVTCKWWDDIWLNEGFATYYNYYPTATIGWKPSETQQVDPRRGLFQFLEIDALNNSEPIRKEVPHVQMAGGTTISTYPKSETHQIDSRGVLSFLDVDARNNSDPIRKIVLDVQMANDAAYGSTYPKGGAMLRMISGILTQDTFQKGLTRYLDATQYTGGVTDDLWEALSTQAAADGITNPDGSALNMKSRMDPWFNQMGFPLVTFTRGAGGTATMTRTHFLNPVNQIMETPSPWNYEWDVPITVVTSHSTEEDLDAPPVAWIDIDQTEATLTGLPEGEDDWVLLNSKGKMFYRVDYDQDSRKAIINQLALDHGVFDEQTITAFLDDTFTFSKAGMIPATTALDATPFLSEILTYNPWYPAVKHFANIERLLAKEPWFNLFRSYVLDLVGPVYTVLGWEYPETDTPLDEYHRRDMISLSCGDGGLNCLDTAIQQYYLARDDPTANVVNPNSLPTVLCTGIQSFVTNWQIWMDEYLNNRKNSQILEERYAYLFALTCTNSQTALSDYLAAITGTRIADRDKNTAARYLALNDYGAILLWDYLDTNWNTPAFSAKFTIMTTIAGGFTTQADLDNLRAFVGRHPPTSQGEINSYVQMILSVEQNIQWLTNNRDDMKDWLDARAGKSVSSVAMRPDRLIMSPVHHWMTVEEEHTRSLDNVQWL